ncbi:MAG: hypothetical protein PHW19_11905 [Salinivirgaceae bacterium]|nr:hypothetical protein [Salinivirgaceae bacterium]
MKKGIFILLALAISSTVLKAQRTPYIPVLTDSVYWWDIMRGEDGGLGLGFDSVYQTTVYNDTIYYNMYQG